MPFAFFAFHDLPTSRVSAFCLRFFDIEKPWPISWVDKNVAGGLGILLDDLIAGLFAGGIIYTIFIFI